MQVQVSKGLATWAGLVAAVGQYLLAIALFMDTFNDADPLAGLGALATATATLWKVIEGRMKQAEAATAADATVQAAATVAAAQPAPTPGFTIVSASESARIVAEADEFDEFDEFGEGNTTGCGPNRGD